MTQLLLCQSNTTALPRSPTPEGAGQPLPLSVLSQKPLITQDNLLGTCYALHHARWCRNPLHRPAGPQPCWEVRSAPRASRLDLPKTWAKPSSSCPLANICVMQRTEITLDCLPCVSKGPTGKQKGVLTLHSTQQSSRRVPSPSTAPSRAAPCQGPKQDPCTSSIPKVNRLQRIFISLDQAMKASPCWK